MWEFDKPIRKLYTLFHVELHTRNVSHWWDLETESVLPIFIFEFIRQYSRNGLKENIHLISCEKKDTSRQSKAKYPFKCRESRIEIELLVEILTFRTPSMERENTYIKSFHWLMNIKYIQYSNLIRKWCWQISGENMGSIYKSVRYSYQRFHKTRSFIGSVLKSIAKIMTMPRFNNHSDISAALTNDKSKIKMVEIFGNWYCVWYSMSGLKLFAWEWEWECHLHVSNCCQYYERF